MFSVLNVPDKAGALRLLAYVLGDVSVDLTLPEYCPNSTSKDGGPVAETLQLDVRLRSTIICVHVTWAWLWASLRKCCKAKTENARGTGVRPRADK